MSVLIPTSSIYHKLLSLVKLLKEFPEGSLEEEVHVFFHAVLFYQWTDVSSCPSLGYSSSPPLRGFLAK